MSTTNFYFNTLGHYGEQNLIEDLIVESIKIYGIDCYYLPRTIVSEDLLFGEDTLSKFDNAYQLEMYIKSVNGFEGDGTFLSKFGLEIRDEMVLSVSQRRFGEEIPYDDTTKEAGRPVEGDLIYFPLNKKIYEIKFVEHEVVFYQMGKLQTYDLTCELFEYSSERIDTGIQAIDAIEDKYSLADQNVRISLETYLPIGEAVAIVADAIISGATIVNQSAEQPNNYVPNIGIEPPQGTPVRATGTVNFKQLNDTDNLSGVIANDAISSISVETPGFPYNNLGNFSGNSQVIVENPSIGFGRFGNHSLNVTDNSYKFANATLEIAYANNKVVANTTSNLKFFAEEAYGYVSLWLYANSLPTSEESPAALFKTAGVYGVDTEFERSGVVTPSPNNFRKIVGIDDQGRITLSRENSGTSVPEILTTESIISTNNWIYLTYALEDYNGSNYQRVFANGVLKCNQTVSSDYLGITSFANGYFGAALATTHYAGSASAATLSKFDGFIDMIHINKNPQTLYTQSATPSFVTPTDPDTFNADTLYINYYFAQAGSGRLVANTQTLSVNNVIVVDSGSGYYNTNRYNNGISYNVTFPQANTRNATLAVNMVDDKLNSIVVHQAGFGYLPEEHPKINITPIEDPEGGRLVFEDGSTIQSESVRLEDSDSSANNEYFTQQAGSESYDTTFIDFNDQNPFSEGGNW